MRSRAGWVLTVGGTAIALALLGWGRSRTTIADGRAAPSSSGPGASRPRSNPAGNGSSSAQPPGSAGESSDSGVVEAEPLRRSKEVYKALTSYADTGTLDEDWGSITHHEFKTYFRRSTHDYYFDHRMLYQEDPKKSRLTFDNSRRVWWMRNRMLETYFFETKEHRTYPPTSNQAAALNEPRTQGASLLISELLFSGSNLPGTLLQIEESSDAGFEDVAGHPCHKVIGVAAAYYPSGQRTGVRQVTVWIDRDTMLIRKVFEDTPKSYSAGSIRRLTVRIEPQANPTLDDSKFEFHVPDTQQ